MTQDDQPKAKPSDDAKFFVTIAVLLVLIIATLSALWIRERSTRREAERALAQSSQFMPNQLNSILAQMSVGRAQSMPAKPIDRADLQTGTVSLDGQDRPVFRISASAGGRMGFLPGDVVIVSMPASAPSGDEPAQPADSASSTMPASQPAQAD
jgi:hypothetical protein